MKQGRFFETVIRVVQEALKDSHFTRIDQNHKLIDDLGIEREIDVFIESYTKDFNVNVAIECKDHKRKVEIGLMDAYITKCNDMHQVHRKIFVSRAGFQKGAIIKAQHHGVELFLLETLTELDVLNWLKIDVPTPVDIKRFISNPRVHFVAEPFNISPNDILILDGKELPLIEFMTRVAKEKIEKERIIICTVDDPRPKRLTIQLGIEFPLAYLKKGELKSQISHLWFNVEQQYEDLKSEVSFDKYLDYTDDNEVTQSVTVVSEKEDIYSFVKKKGEDEIQIIGTFGDENNKEIIKYGKMKVEKIDTSLNKDDI